MKKIELAEIKKMDGKLITERVKKAQAELADLTMDKNMKKQANLKTLKNKRRDIAQMLTILRQKQILESLGGQNGK